MASYAPNDYLTSKIHWYELGTYDTCTRFGSLDWDYQYSLMFYHFMLCNQGLIKRMTNTTNQRTRRRTSLAPKFPLTMKNSRKNLMLWLWRRQRSWKQHARSEWSYLLPNKRQPRAKFLLRMIVMKIKCNIWSHSRKSLLTFLPVCVTL